MQPDVSGGLRRAVGELSCLAPGTAVSFGDIVEQLARAGVVRDRGTLRHWLVAEARDEDGVLFLVARGYYALRDPGEDASAAGTPVLPTAETEVRVLEAIATLHRGGQASFTLLELVAEVGRCGAALSRRRLHDVVTTMRTAVPPLVERAEYGRFRATDT